MNAIIKLKKSDSNLKSIGLYQNSFYEVKGGEIKNERGEWLPVSWWNLEHEIVEEL